MPCSSFCMNALRGFFLESMSILNMFQHSVGVSTSEERRTGRSATLGVLGEQGLGGKEKQKPTADAKKIVLTCDITCCLGDFSLIAKMLK